MLSSLTTAKWLYNNNKNPKCKQWPLIALHSNEVIMTPQDFLLEMNKSDAQKVSREAASIQQRIIFAFL